MNEPDHDALLVARGIRKTFSGVTALADGSIELRRGEVHALCGGNGAGKSTLLKILMGFVEPDAGEILIRGSRVHFTRPRDALDAGIAIVQQELSAVPDLSVAENIFLGAEPRRYGFVDYPKLNRDAVELLRTLGCNVDPREKMRRLSVAAQQLVEIAKALSHRNAEILIFDEPTSAIGEHDTARLFAAIRELVAAGKGIVYVTHRLGEIFQIAQRYTVLRDGVTAGTGRVTEINQERLVEMMIGAPVERELEREGTSRGAALLEVSNLVRTPYFESVSFTLHRGEVLGFYGRVGSGRTEVLETVYGLRRPDRGKVSVGGTALPAGDTRGAIEAGLGYVPEDRKRNGLISCASVGENLVLAVLPRAQKLGLISGRKLERYVATGLARLRIRPGDGRQFVKFLSGGNQQKVVLGRAILGEPQVLLLDEPTRGVDVGVKHEIYRFIAEFAGGGGGVILVSSELEEVLGLSDRILVFRGGRMVTAFTRKEASEKKLLMAAA